MQITDTLRTVVIESPLAGDGTPEALEANLTFARRVLHWALVHGYAPYAMHLLYPQVLNDADPNDRALGISAGLSWTKRGDEVWFVTRPGEELSRGMRLAWDRDAARQQAGELDVVRRLTFTPEGQLLSGWDGPPPLPVLNHHVAGQIRQTERGASPIPPAGSAPSAPKAARAETPASPPPRGPRR